MHEIDFTNDELDEALANAGLELVCDERGLALVGEGMTVRADFSELLPRIGHNRLSRELLVRAARIRGAAKAPVLVDATAGLGEDSFLLAAAGFDVRLCECNPVIVAMLEDAVIRAREDERLHDAACRMHVCAGDSIQMLCALEERPDVVYLDPMFPVRAKSAAVKKKFQLLHKLERPCEDEAALLGAALAAHPRKVVIKRPLKGPYLAGVKPSHSLAGKAIRYDCIVC